MEPLEFVVAGEAPSKDGAQGNPPTPSSTPTHRSTACLIRVDPENPQSADFVCDLCVGDVPEPTNGAKTYTFKVKEGVTFHDGTPLTAQDVKATYDKIIFPPEGIPSARKAFFKMVDSVEAPDDTTIVFNLKFPSGAFLPALATPFNWTYSKKDLDEHGYGWHANNVNGTGPFKFVQHQPGAFRGWRAQRQLPPRGAAIPRRLQGGHRQEDVGAHPGNSRQPGCDRVPGLPAEGTRRSGERVG